MKGLVEDMVKGRRRRNTNRRLKFVRERGIQAQNEEVGVAGLGFILRQMSRFGRFVMRGNQTESEHLRSECVHRAGDRPTGVRSGQGPRCQKQSPEGLRFGPTPSYPSY